MAYRAAHVVIVAASAQVRTSVTAPDVDQDVCRTVRCGTASLTGTAEVRATLTQA
jgi:hypothetical protein